MDRKQIAEDISADHLDRARDEVRHAVRVTWELVENHDPEAWEASTPELLIDAIMGRIAPLMLAACQQAIEVDRQTGADLADQELD